jgi:molybdate transport system substrate-binding protein
MKPALSYLFELGLTAYLLLAIPAFTPAAPSSDSKSLRLGCAAGYKKPIIKILHDFSRQTGIRVEPVFGNMQQIIAQAKVTGTMPILIGDKAFLDSSQFPLSIFRPIGKGRLVLAYKKGLKITGLKDLLSARIERVGITDEKKAIYGKAAKECLLNQGLYERLKDKLLVSPTIPQASAYLMLGEVDAAFLNLTEALSIRGRISGFIELDARCYTPVEIGIGVIEGVNDLKGVGELLSFFDTDDARAILLQHGL